VSHHPGRLALEHLGLSGSLNEVISQPDFQVGHVALGHMSHAVGSSEDVSVSDQRATTELTAVVEQSRYPGPLALICRPAVHHPEGMLAVVVNPLLFLRHGPVTVVSDGMIFPVAAVLGVAGPGPGGTLGRGRLVSDGHSGRSRAGGRQALGRTSTTTTRLLL